MNKILPLVLLLFFLIPISNVFAQEKIQPWNKGLLNNSSIIESNNTYYIMMDDNLETTLSQGVPSNATIVFKEPQKISHLQVLIVNQSGYSNTFNFYDVNNVLLKTYATPVNMPTNPDIIAMNLEGVKKVTLSAYKLTEFDFYNNAPIPINPVTDLSETHTYNSINLSWKNPNHADFTGIVIKKDGVEIATLPTNKSSYELVSLASNTSYAFEVIAKYGNSFATGQKINVTTDSEPVKPPPPPEVSDLIVNATHERVDLSWSLPKAENFKHVNIYRDTIRKTALIDKFLGVEMVYAAENKIFETNGTYFNDLTVSPSTTYEYTISTTSIQSVESDGITKKVTTSDKPKPSIGGGGYEEDEKTGDYTYSWTSPTTGQVKVMVGGVLYKTVAASDRKIVIPKASMKFNILGSPDVYLIPVDEDGTEGVPAKPPSSGGIGGVDIPFSPNDLLKSGMGLMFVVGPFVLLALAFLLVPKLRNMIVQAFNQKKGQQTVTGRRFNA